MAEMNLSSDAAVESGIKAILEIEGTLLKPTKEASTFEGANIDQLKLQLADAVILKMVEGAEQPELKDNIFTQWLKYGKNGAQAPVKGTFLVKHFLPDAEKLYAKLTNAPVIPGTLMNLVGQRVRWVRLDVPYTIKDKVTGEEKKGISSHYTFALDIMTPEDIKTHVKKLVVGKNETAAKRALVMDAVAKTHPEYKAALDNNTLTDTLGITQVDGVFASV